MPRTDYLSMLDRRLKRMEERLLKCVPKEEVNAMLANTGRSVVRPAITTAGKKRSAETAFEDEPSSWASSSKPRHHHLEGAPAPPPPPLPLSLQPAAAAAAAAADSDSGLHALPPKDIQEHLAEVFFDYVYGQPYFLLHKPSFMRRLK